ncbi:MAG: glucose-1-phosphate cytidylyltransferase [Planctomycetes bacterium]|jgi:glucose-1-phosphate cytidylyltransferase|nr:glucose-1-phosphate cytidylyltransferase [Planctomycetota bacterium]
MKAVILAGGLGTRLSEETAIRPKPMVEVGPEPILWHIMKTYAHHGVNDFVVCCGYKQEVIKRYFAEYALTRANVHIDLANESVKLTDHAVEPWRVSLIDTGDQTMTGGRIRRIREYVKDGPFCLTYGDGVSDIDITAQIKFHQSHGGLATVTAVQPPGRFGAFVMHEDSTQIRTFREKPQGDGAWINGGYFVCDPKVIDLIDGDSTVWEKQPMTRLAHDGQLFAYKHTGFWQPMDTLRDKNYLESLWDSGEAPWKVWA